MARGIEKYKLGGRRWRVICETSQAKSKRRAVMVTTKYLQRRRGSGNRRLGNIVALMTPSGWRSSARIGVAGGAAARRRNAASR